MALGQVLKAVRTRPRRKFVPRVIRLIVAMEVFVQSVHSVVAQCAAALGISVRDMGVLLTVLSNVVPTIATLDNNAPGPAAANQLAP
jgi:hypothetical protein